MFIRYLLLLSVSLAIFGCLPQNTRSSESIASSLAPSLQTNHTDAALLWPTLRGSFVVKSDLNHPLIQKQLKWLSKHPQYVIRAISNAQPFLGHILGQLQTRQMPGELALLPMVESGYDPFAYSHQGAAGLWQLMPRTGQLMGLNNNWWFDGRRDVILSTDAALNYLNRLHNIFHGDWLLTLAAYNAGAGKVLQAIKRNQRLNRPTDFFSLPLPQETRDFVPRILALAQVITRPYQFQVALADIELEPAFEVITLDKQFDLYQAAKMAGITPRELYQLNAGCSRFASPPKGPHRLLLPKTAALQFKNALAALDPKTTLQWARYQVKTGDSLIKIAKNYHVDIASIKRINKLKNNTIRQNAFLMIPQSPHYRKTYTPTAHRSPIVRKINYQVKPGDSLGKIAKRYHVSVGGLKRWNTIAHNKYLQPGDHLEIYVHIAGRKA